MALDMGSVLAKAQAAITSGAAKSRYKATVKNIVTNGAKLSSGETVHAPDEAAEKFIEVMQKNINSSGLSAGAQSAISSLAYTVSGSADDGEFQIGVYFNGNLSRPSLSPKYGGISDLAELFDQGVDHTMNPVYGYWNGQWVRSRTTIPGAHFMDAGAGEFMGSYADEYHVRRLTINRYH